MHVETKKVATAGLLVAFSVILMWLSSMIEMSTLFFISAASFCVGIAIREWGLKYGLAFGVASFLLNLFVTPEKLYCFTYGAMGIYIWFNEWLYFKLGESRKVRRRVLWLWIGKYLCFNVIYIPILFFAPKLVFTGKINGLSVGLFWILGQIGLYVYDVAYRYFQSQIWGKIRNSKSFQRN